MTELNDFQIRAANWRETLRKNTQRTRIVIGAFFAIYIAVGLLIDLYIASMHLNAPLSQLFLALITLKITPIATIIMIIIACISVLVMFAAHNSLMLLGTEYYEVNPQTFNKLEGGQQLYNIVEELKIAAGLRYMPKIFIIEAPYMNAFASGFNEKNSMIAITRGLMNKLNRAEIQAVMAHELSHIRHGDIKLTLTVSVLSNLMLVAIDMLFYSVLFSGGGDRDRRDNAAWLFAIVMILRFTLPIITVLLMLYLSRTREYMADAGSIELTRDNQPLASALIKIHEDHTSNQEHYAQQYGQTQHEDMRRASYLYDPKAAGISVTNSIAGMFSTHPDLKDRLKAMGVKSPE